MELTSLEQRSEFFRALVRELINNSIKKIELYHLETLTERKYGIPVKEDQKEILKHIIKEREKKIEKKIEKQDLRDSVIELSSYSPSEFNFKKPLRLATKDFPFLPKKSSAREFSNIKQKNSFVLSKKRVLRIPEPRLPDRFRNLKPVKSFGQINLGKLLPFAQDNNVKVIEVNGEGENVFVNGLMGRKKTGVILSKPEINSLINEFSSLTKIPISEGINKIAYGNLVLKSVFSEGENVSFSLSKIENSSSQSSGVRVGGKHMKRRVF